MEKRVCPSCAALAKNLRIIAAEDAAAIKQVYGEKEPPPEVARPDDGRHLRLRPEAQAQA